MQFLRYLHEAGADGAVVHSRVPHWLSAVVVDTLEWVRMLLRPSVGYQYQYDWSFSTIRILLGHVCPKVLPVFHFDTASLGHSNNGENFFSQCFFSLQGAFLN